MDPTGGWKAYWHRFQLQWNKVSIYWGFGIISVLIISFRNWLVGGAFFVANIQHGNFTREELERGNFFYIITAKQLGAVTFDFRIYCGTRRFRFIAYLILAS